MSLYVEEYGQADAQPLVLLHGWGMSGAIWQSWLPALEERFRVLVVDLPGLGRSEFAGEQPYTLSVVVEQIVQQIGPQLSRPAIWLGWSLGGVVAAQIVDVHPTLAKGLVTVSTNPCFVQRADWPAAMPAATFESFQNALVSQPLKTLNRFALLQTQGSPEGRKLLAQLKAVIADSAGGAAHLAEALALLSEDYRSLFSRLTLPRLFLFANEDALVPVAVAQADLVRDQAQVIEHAGHLPFICAQKPLTQGLLCWAKELTHG